MHILFLAIVSYRIFLSKQQKSKKHPQKQSPDYQAQATQKNTFKFQGFLFLKIKKVGYSVHSCGLTFKYFKTKMITV